MVPIPDRILDVLYHACHHILRYGACAMCMGCQEFLIAIHIISLAGPDPN